MHVVFLLLFALILSPPYPFASLIPSVRLVIPLPLSFSHKPSFVFLVNCLISSSLSSSQSPLILIKPLLLLPLHHYFFSNGDLPFSSHSFRHLMTPSHHIVFPTHIQTKMEETFSRRNRRRQGNERKTQNQERRFPRRRIQSQNVNDESKKNQMIIHRHHSYRLTDHTSLH